MLPTRADFMIIDVELSLLVTCVTWYQLEIRLWRPQEIDDLGELVVTSRVLFAYIMYMRKNLITIKRSINDLELSKDI
jgi:hypothetical protein